MADNNSNIDRLSEYLLRVFNSAVGEAQLQSTLHQRFKDVEAAETSSDADPPPTSIMTPVAFGICTHSGYLAGGSVFNPVSKLNSDGTNVIDEALKNLQALEAIMQTREGFSIAAVAATTDTCPQKGTPLDFDWSLYPEQYKFFKDQGINDILLVAPDTGHSRRMPLPPQLCA